MNDTTILNEMFKPNIRVHTQDFYGRPGVVLREPLENSEMSIRHLPDDAIIVNADAFPAPKSFFSGIKHECKRADFIIISEQKKTALFIEMKKTKGEWKDIVKQLGGAACLFAYCREIGKFFWKEKDFLRDYNCRFISVGHTSIPKRKMLIERTAACHDEPHKAERINWPNYLQYNKLIGQAID